MKHLQIFFLCITTFMVCFSSLKSSKDQFTLELSFGDLEGPQFEEAMLKLISHGEEQFPEILETPRLRQNTQDEQDPMYIAQNKKHSFDSVSISKKYSADISNDGDEFQEKEFSFRTEKGKRDFFLDLSPISKHSTTNENTSSYFNEKYFLQSQEKKSGTLKKSKSFKNIFEKDNIISYSSIARKQIIESEGLNEKNRKQSMVSNNSNVSKTSTQSSRKTKIMLRIFQDLNENSKIISKINDGYRFYSKSIPSPRLESPKKNSPQHDVIKPSPAKENISNDKNLLSNYYIKTPSSKKTKMMLGIVKNLNVQSPKKISEILNEVYGFYPESISPQTPRLLNFESPTKNSPQHHVIKLPIKKEISQFCSNEKFLAKKFKLVSNDAEKYMTPHCCSYNSFVKAFLSLNKNNMKDMVQKVVKYERIQMEPLSTNEIVSFLKDLRNKKNPNKVFEQSVKKIHGSYRESILLRVKDLSSENSREIFHPFIEKWKSPKKNIASLENKSLLEENALHKVSELMESHGQKTQMKI